MLDNRVSIYYKNLMSPIADLLIQSNIKATHVTILGFVIGMFSVPLIAYGYFYFALVCVLFNRASDGLDGLLAHKTTPTAVGAFLDITLDFTFYSAIPLAFALYAPATNALAASILIYSFVLTGSSFLISAIFAQRNNIPDDIYQNKFFYYSLGLIEATETILFFILVLLLPDYFVMLSYCFSVLCLLTFAVRSFHMILILKR